ncbi:hypothetical protein ACNVD4_18915, partial [Rhizobium sp. BR5]
MQQNGKLKNHTAQTKTAALSQTLEDRAARRRLLTRFPGFQRPLWTCQMRCRKRASFIAAHK